MNEPNRRRRLLPAAPLAPLPAPQLDACGVTARFGVAELLGLVALYALVFGLLSLMRAPWWLFLAVGLFMAGVAVAQPVLFGGTRPRRAAALAERGGLGDRGAPRGCCQASVVSHPGTTSVVSPGHMPDTARLSDAVCVTSLAPRLPFDDIPGRRRLHTRISVDATSFAIYT